MEREAEELPILTPKQEAFVHALLKGETASDAYRAAYNASRMTDRTIWAEASRLRAHPKVSAWLRHSQRMGLETARLTRESHLAELARAREEAIASGQISTAVQAEHHRGKAAGLYEDRFNISASISDADLVKAIENLLGKEIAKAIGTKLGVCEEGSKGITGD